jgi:hypothetical protein
VKKSLEDWLDGKGPDELKALEHKGRLFYPDVVHRFATVNGERVQITDEVYVRVPNPVETAVARTAAIAMVRTIAKDDSIKTVEAARGAVDTVLWEELDAYHFVAAALFRREEPPGEYMLPKFLIDTVPRGVVFGLVDRIAFYNRLEDPRIGEDSDPRDYVRAVRGIAKKLNLSPLVDFGGFARERLVISMAVQLESSPTFRSFAESLETSTPDK